MYILEATVVEKFANCVQGSSFVDISVYYTTASKHEVELESAPRQEEKGHCHYSVGPKSNYIHNSRRLTSDKPPWK